MTYQDDAALYRDAAFRNRADMCIREQGFVYAANPDAANAALGRGVTGGNMQDIDAIMAATVTAPGNEGLEDDAALLGGVQAVWATVAAARYPQT